MQKIGAKTYKDCYLYNKYNLYGKMLIDAIMNGERIDVTNKNFDHVVYDINRSRCAKYGKQALTSENLILLFPKKPLPKYFKVFAVKDIKSGSKYPKAFIDCTNIITKDKNGNYACNTVQLSSHLISSAHYLSYAVKDELLYSTTKSLKILAIAFAKLFTHIVDYIGKISTIDYAKDKCLYYCVMYYMVNIQNFNSNSKRSDLSQASEHAGAISGISQIKRNVYENNIERYTEEKGFPFENIDTFCKFISKEFNLEVGTQVFVEKWMYFYGQSTVFALEFLPALSQLLTDAYCGGYLNNQKTIEKIIPTEMVNYYNEINR